MIGRVCRALLPRNKRSLPNSSCSLGEEHVFTGPASEGFCGLNGEYDESEEKSGEAHLMRALSAVLPSGDVNRIRSGNPYFAYLNGSYKGMPFIYGGWGCSAASALFCLYVSLKDKPAWEKEFQVLRDEELLQRKSSEEMMAWNNRASGY